MYIYQSGFVQPTLQISLNVIGSNVCNVYQTKYLYTSLVVYSLHYKYRCMSQAATFVTFIKLSIYIFLSGCVQPTLHVSLNVIGSNVCNVYQTQHYIYQYGCVQPTLQVSLNVIDSNVFNVYQTQYFNTSLVVYSLHYTYR